MVPSAIVADHQRLVAVVGDAREPSRALGGIAPTRWSQAQPVSGWLPSVRCSPARILGDVRSSGALSWRSGVDDGWRGPLPKAHMCALWGSARLLKASHPGYKRPAMFAIVECSFCDAQFAEPRIVDPRIYDDIYRRAATLPGYSRYIRYADAIRDQRDPLEWLAEREDMYWFIAETLRRTADINSTKIIELGSGLGFLTYALHRRGYDVRGIEVSARAVDDATRRFGPLYDLANVTQLCVEVQAAADVLILTEVIEHVADPRHLLRCVRDMLRPGGLALVTTPNKSLHPQGAYWRTENPPVHLWWFSETSLRRLAESIFSEISFCDFTAFVSVRDPAERRIEAMAPPFLGHDGDQVCGDSEGGGRLVATVRSVGRSTPQLSLEFGDGGAGGCAVVTAGLLGYNVAHPWG